MSLVLHHVGVLVKDIRETANYYFQLGYQPATQIVHDPVQTTFAQFLKLPTDHVYLELISPDRPGSRLSNALSKGGGLNHICYRTANIEQSCAALHSAGAFLISRPVAAIAFPGKRIAWLMSAGGLLTELLEGDSDRDCQPRDSPEPIRYTPAT